ncbi:MAG: hypothetical protein AVDCRST_MAG48-336, partial [uncultured Friedmanniella sp.]
GWAWSSRCRSSSRWRCCWPPTPASRPGRSSRRTPTPPRCRRSCWRSPGRWRRLTRRRPMTP